MSGVGKTLIQSPETAHETFGILCDRFGKITALWGNRTDDRDGTVGSVQIVHHSGSSRRNADRRDAR